MSLVQFVRTIMLAYVHTPIYTHVIRCILQYTKRGILHFARLRICQSGQMHIWACEPVGILPKAYVCGVAYVHICMMTE